MNPLTASIALTGALLFTAPALLQSGKERPPRQTPAPSVVPILKDLQGAWKLVEFTSRNVRTERRQEVGYLLVSGEFLSFECHLGWMDDGGKRDASTFFSGTHTLELRQDGVMVLTSLIGSSVDPVGLPMFEEPGRTREYKVKFEGTKLTLVRDLDEQTFRFEKVSLDPGLDFYGRKKKTPPAEAPPMPPKDGEKKKD